jgi:Domain of unknown function (DUF5076)
MTMAKKIGELPIPPAALSDERAVELVRVWASNKKQHVTLASEAWPDPAAWGIMLVDLARHVAQAFQQRTGSDPQQTLARIRQGFDAEWDSPTE